MIEAYRPRDEMYLKTTAEYIYVLEKAVNLYKNYECSHKKEIFKKEFKEDLYVLYLDKLNKLLEIEYHSRGTYDRCILNTKEIIERSMKINSNKIVLIHTHPDVHVYSNQDEQAYIKSKIILSEFFIELEDSIVVHEEGYSSIANKKENHKTNIFTKLLLRDCSEEKAIKMKFSIYKNGIPVFYKISFNDETKPSFKNSKYIIPSIVDTVE